MKILFSLLLLVPAPVNADSASYSKIRLFKMVRNNQVIFKEAGPIPQTNGFTWDNSGDFKKIKNPIGDVLMFNLQNGKMSRVQEISSCWTEPTCRKVKLMKFDHGRFSSASRCTAVRDNFQWKSSCESVTADLCRDIKFFHRKLGKFEKCVPSYDDDKVRAECPPLPKPDDKDAQARFQLARMIMQKHEKELSFLAQNTDKLAMELAKTSYKHSKNGWGRHMPAGSPISFAISENTSLPRHSSLGEFYGYLWGLAKANSVCHDAGVMGKLPRK